MVNSLSEQILKVIENNSRLKGFPSESEIKRKNH